MVNIVICFLTFCSVRFHEHVFLTSFLMLFVPVFRFPMKLAISGVVSFIAVYQVNISPPTCMSNVIK